MRRKLLPRTVAAAVPARRREPRRAGRAHRLRYHRRRHVGERAPRHFDLQRPRAGLLFNPNTLAPEYPESEITRPFPFNAYYSEDEAPEIDGDNSSSRSAAWSTTRSRGRCRSCNKLPEVSQITRHVCVEGWSAIGSWQGVPCRISSS